MIGLENDRLEIGSKRGWKKNSASEANGRSLARFTRLYVFNPPSPFANHRIGKVKYLLNFMGLNMVGGDVEQQVL